MGTPIRVLLVEDSEDDAQLIVRELQRGGYDPIWERVDTPAAMQKVIDRQTWDLVLGDYTMPHFSGTAAMTLLRTHGVDVPFIFVSGTIGEDIAVAAMKAGAQDYVMKGNMKRLVPAVRRELGDADVRRERRRADAALLERARLAELSSEVGLALSRGSTVQDILHRCCDGLVRHLDVALAQIWVRNEDTETLILAASAGLGAPPPAPSDGLPVGTPGIGTVAAERRAYLSNDALGDPRVPEQAWVESRGITAFAGYPLLVQGRLVGVMATFGTRLMAEFAFKAAGAMADALAVGIANKQAEEALRRSELTYRSLVEDSPYGIFRSAPDGALLAVNPALVQMLGYGSASDLLAVNLRQIAAAPPDTPAPARDEPGPSTADTQWRRKDGRTLAVRLTSRGVRDAAGRLEPPTIIVEDITDRRVMEAQLRQAQKMEAIGRLAGGVAHDFNNLLTAILGFADLLLQDIPPDHPGREGAVEIREAARRAADLTRQLLAFSRQQVLSPRLLSINDIVVGMEKMLKRLIGADIQFQTTLSSSIGLAHADPGQMEQVLLNLVVNARDAMPQGGTLKIDTANIDLDATYAREHPGVEPGGYVVLSVADTGVGMDATTQTRIFEPFFTTKPTGEGTGLGLATVYGVVQQSGGHIAVASELGRGTTFRVFLRRTDGPVPATPVAPKVRPSKGNETVLLVEDQAEIRRVAQRMLESRGYTVLVAADGTEALGVAASHTGALDAMVTDVVMPGLSGREVAEALRATRPRLRVLFVSGRVPDNTTLGPGAAFLRKPFTADELTRAVRMVLDGEQP